MIDASSNTSLYVINFLGSTTLPAAVHTCSSMSNRQLNICLWTPVLRLSTEITSAETVFETKYFNFLLISFIHLWKNTKQGHSIQIFRILIIIFVSSKYLDS